MCSCSETSFNANFSVHNQEFYLVTLFNISVPEFRVYFYTYQALKIPYSVHVSWFRSPSHIWELTDLQIVKLLSNFLPAVTHSFWSPYILLIKHWNSVMIMAVTRATWSDNSEPSEGFHPKSLHTLYLWFEQ
jgi:hypothetical protein